MPKCLTRALRNPMNSMADWRISSRCLQATREPQEVQIVCSFLRLVSKYWFGGGEHSKSSLQFEPSLIALLTSPNRLTYRLFIVDWRRAVSGMLSACLPATIMTPPNVDFSTPSTRRLGRRQKMSAENTSRMKNKGHQSILQAITSATAVRRNR